MKIVRILIYACLFSTIVFCTKKDYRSELNKKIQKAENEIYSFNPDTLNTRTYKDSLKLSDENIIKLNIGFPVGYLILKKAESNNLMYFESTYTSDDLKPVMNYEIFGGEGTIELKPKYFNIDWKKRKNLAFDKFNNNKLLINITNKVPLKISLELGNVKTVLDFNSIVLSELKIDQNRGLQVLKFLEKNNYRLNEISINLSERVSLFGQNLANSNSLYTSISSNGDLVYLDFTGELYKSMFVELKTINAESRMLMPEKFGVKIVEYEGNFDNLSYDDLEKVKGFLTSKNYNEVPGKIDLKIQNTNGKINIVNQ